MISRLRPTYCHTLLPGSTLCMIRACSGVRGYLAVMDCFAIAPVMGRVSTLARAALGGLAGRPLQKGDWLPLAATPDTVPRQASRPAQRLMPQRERRPVRVIAGPQRGHFAQAGLGAA